MMEGDAALIRPDTRRALSRAAGRLLREVSAAAAQRGAGRRTGHRLELGPLRQAVAGAVAELQARPAAAIGGPGPRTDDWYGVGHLVQVSLLSVATGVLAGLPAPQLADLGLAAVLHDIGKMTVPLGLINKAGPLTADELAVIRQHPVRGFELLCEQLSIPTACALVAYQHHERWTGSGYPLGLAGEEIHPYTRIVTVADVYDAMTADRPYRRGHPPARVLRAMGGMMRGWFEPGILGLFMELIGERQQTGTADPALV